MNFQNKRRYNFKLYYNYHFYNHTIKRNVDYGYDTIKDIEYIPPNMDYYKIKSKLNTLKMTSVNMPPHNRGRLRSIRTVRRYKLRYK